MPQHRSRLRLHHMLDHAREATAMIQGKTRADIDANRQLNLALVRLPEIIGEAAARTSEEERALNPQIPWQEIISLRNRLIHGYDSVDFEILWNVITKDLPPLIEKLDRIVSD